MNNKMFKNKYNKISTNIEVSKYLNNIQDNEDNNSKNKQNNNDKIHSEKENDSIKLFSPSIPLKIVTNANFNKKDIIRCFDCLKFYPKSIILKCFSCSNEQCKECADKYTESTNAKVNLATFICRECMEPKIKKR